MVCGVRVYCIVACVCVCVCVCVHAGACQKRCWSKCCLQTKGDIFVAAVFWIYM